MRPLPALHPFQKEDVLRMLSIPFAIMNNNPLGSGKTREALATAQGFLDLGIADHVLIVTKKITIELAWAREIQKMFPHLKFQCVDGSLSAKRRKNIWLCHASLPEIVIINWELLHNPIESKFLPAIFKNKKWALVGDESHVLSNHRTKTWTAWVRLRRCAQRIIQMTGTPLQTSPTDLYGMLSALGCDMGTFNDYMNQWCVTEQYRVPAPGTYKGFRVITKPIGFREDRLEALRKMLVKTCIRRAPSEITLPPLRTIDYSIELNREEDELYTPLHQKFCNGKSAASMSDSEIVSLASSNNLSLHGDLRAVLSGKRAQAMRPSKDQVLVEELPDWTANNNKMVLFSPYKETIDRLVLLLQSEFPSKKFTRLTGDESTQERMTNARLFQTDPNCIVLLMTTAAAEGVDGLQEAATRVLFFDRLYNPAKEDQILKRVYRQGQTRECIRINFEMKGTLDQRIVSVLEERRELINIVDELSREKLTPNGRKLLETDQP